MQYSLKAGPEQEHELSRSEAMRLSELLAALRTSCEVYRNEGSALGTAVFEEDFRSRLLAQHVFFRTPLFQDSFEAAFIGACQSAGWEINSAPAGQRFWDVELQGRKISLKSTKAKSVRSDALHISKLTEAAWIQDCRTAAARQDKTFELFVEYTTEVHSIIQLRYFQSKRKYELVEIPVSLLCGILDVPRAYFQADGPTINIPVGQDPPDFTLKIDRSDAKITLANIRKERCVVHGTWQIMS
jgi:hypothetical protein